jgi:hypothetical protein
VFAERVDKGNLSSRLSVAPGLAQGGEKSTQGYNKIGRDLRQLPAEETRQLWYHIDEQFAT